MDRFARYLRALLLLIIGLATASAIGTAHVAQGAPGEYAFAGLAADGAAGTPEEWESVGHRAADSAIRSALRASSDAGGKKVSAVLRNPMQPMRQLVYLDDVSYEYATHTTGLDKGSIHMYRRGGKAWQDNGWRAARMHGHHWAALAGRLVAPNALLTGMPVPRHEVVGPLGSDVDQVLANAVPGFARWRQSRLAALRSVVGTTTTWRLPSDSSFHTDLVLVSGSLESIRTVTDFGDIIVSLQITGRGDEARLPRTSAPILSWSRALSYGRWLKGSARTARQRALRQRDRKAEATDRRLPRGWGTRVRWSARGPVLHAHNATRNYPVRYVTLFPSSPRGLDATMRREVVSLAGTLSTSWVVDSRGRPPRVVRWDARRHAVLFNVRHGRERYIIPLPRGVRFGSYVRAGTAFCVDLRAPRSRSGVARYDSRTGRAELRRTCPASLDHRRAPSRMVSLFAG